MENKNNTVWWILGLVVVAIIIIVAVRMNRNSDSMDGITDGSDDSSVLEPSEDVTEGSVNTPTTATPAPATISYQNALVAYAKTRLQFDAMCAATPGTVITVKNGTNMMYDNRSANTLNLHIGALGNISIKPWGFKIVKMTGDPLPATVLVDCGTRQNVAQVLVQK